MKAHRFILLFVVLLFCCRPLTVKADNTDKRGKLIVFFIDRISLYDIINTPTENIDYLASIGGIGLMTINTGGTRSQRDTYLSMGAGQAVIGSDNSNLGLNAQEHYQGEKAADIYKRITGDQCSEQACVNLGIAQTIRNNFNKPYSVTIGALGSTLMNAGLTPAVIGNCDTADEHKRYITSFLMNNQGIVPVGMVDKSYLYADNYRPFALRTDYNILYNYVNKALTVADIVAVQLGDTSRAEDFRYTATDEMNSFYKELAIKEADSFIGKVVKQLDLEKDLVMVVSPLNPAKELAINNRLTPIIIAGKGYERGFLSSASTKRQGLVSGHDIGATILSYFNLEKQYGENGNKIVSYASEKGLADLSAFNKELVEIFNQRGFLLRNYVFAQILLLLSALYIIIYKGRYFDLAYMGIFFLLSLPLSYLILPLFHHPSLIITFIISWTLAGLIGLGLYNIKLDMIYKIIIISLTTVSLLLLDQILGASLIKGSPLGYDAISGARFYGIGNEYMGILVGATTIACGGLLEKTSSVKHRTRVKALIFILPSLVLIILAYPGLGANVGGTIAAGISFASLFILTRKNKITVKHLIYIGLFTALIVVSIFLIDSLRAIDNQSHMGQTVNLLKQKGIYEFFNIVKRKISMNIKLLKYTIWARVLILSLLTMAVLVFRPVGVARKIKKAHPDMIKGLASGIIGAISALLVNDSGVVAAATAMIFIVLPFILLVCKHLESRKKDTMETIS